MAGYHQIFLLDDVPQSARELHYPIVPTCHYLLYSGHGVKEAVAAFPSPPSRVQTRSYHSLDVDISRVRYTRYMGKAKR